ncbi:MAG: ATP-binding protein [Flavobacteriaceae bacterium]|jgi:predicted AAA+ superfamily ATPase|nr:ATP-binding protein [Flavobacteriaceae bacterium]
MIKRDLQKILESNINSGKIIILVGARQVGKTTLIQDILKNKKNVLFLNGDDPAVRRILANINTEELKNLLNGYSFAFIDEAQRIENIGITLKIIADQIKNIQIFASGSSAFEINNLMQESLTGRKWEYLLLPISWKEFEENQGYLKSQQQLNLRIVYGMYPEVINNFGNEYEILKQLAESYLYKDILNFSGIRKPEILENLLKALAYQVGGEVSYNELSKLLSVDVKTVSNYIDLCVQNYIIFKLPSFSRNLRNEIKNNQKIYFWDNGIRNIIIGNLNHIETREDVGKLWENFLISERLKKINNELLLTKSFFWRTRQQQEIDYIEDFNGKIFGYEIKWGSNSKLKIPKTFTNSYNSDIRLINQNNFRDFVI